MWGQRNNPQMEQVIANLLTAWRTTQRPVFHVQHCSTELASPLRPDRPGHAFKPEAQPRAGEPIIQKQVNSAFIGTDLEAMLRQRGIDTLVMVGLTTNHCVSTTARMAGNLGFTTYIVADAVATFDRLGHDGQHHPAATIHATALASLHLEFAMVVQAAQVLAALR
ncbi:MAG: cysteine hydrolase [Chloroflexaceae bacterium]|nr:cysteine hydrolase [Chloroflexaceae bacterium]